MMSDLVETLMYHLVEPLLVETPLVETHPHLEIHMVVIIQLLIFGWPLSSDLQPGP